MKIIDKRIIITSAITFAFLIGGLLFNYTSVSYANSELDTNTETGSTNNANEDTTDGTEINIDPNEISKLTTPEIECFNKSTTENNALVVNIISNNEGSDFSLELLNTTTGKINMLAGSSTSYTYQKLEKNKEYKVQVRACNSNSDTYTCSEWSKQSEATAGDIPQDIDPGHTILHKPIIYLYPERETKLSVKLGKPENITTSYPEYKNGWNVIAKKDGTLIDTETGRKLYSLYWEGKGYEKPNTNEGFVVKGKDTIKFLEEKLAQLGLNEFEAEEFIVYWLPELQNNKYNYIRFATIEEINKTMPLEFSTKPDTLIRVLMQYKPLDSKIKVKEQKIKTPERKGFVAVEWGGTEIK